MLNEKIVDYYGEGNKISNSLEEINKLEEKYNLILPKEYKSFLMKYNGVEFLSPVYNLEINENTYHIPISRLYNIYDDEKEQSAGLYWINNEYIEEIPKGFLIIGSSDGLLLLDTKTEDLYYWDDERVLEISNDNKNSYKIINGFNNFLDKLYELED